jgi:uncharacterized membrane protein/Mg-chelatase subunit ChlD
LFNFRLGFDSPGYLALLAVLPLLWWASYRSLAGMGSVRRWVAILLRSIVLTLLVFALADMQWKRLGDRLTVIYVVDESLSIPENLKPAMIEYVDREIRTHRQAHIADRAGVVVFGGEPAIEHPPYDENIQVTYNTESHIDREHTNLAAALRLAQATFPEDSARRVVLLTDGNENVGDGLTQARSLAESGIGIDVMPIRYPPRSEVAVEKVVIPPDVNRGQPFDLRVVLDNIAPPDAKEGAVKGQLRIIRKTQDHEEVLRWENGDTERAVTLEPGKRVFTIREQIDAPDFYTYEARFIPDDAAHDPIKQNKRATAYTHVRGKGQVLLIEDQENRGEFSFLVDRLKQENLEARVQSTAETFATLADLQPFDTVILADTPAEGFTEDQIKMLVSNTEQMGAGLIMLGGPNSFGAGGWTNTPLEAAMPVDFQIKNSKVVPVGALAMLMHASEMAEGNFWQKKIAQEAVRALGAQDYCGVLHWEGNIQWLWNPGLARVGANRDPMLAKIDKMIPGDMPEFEGAMKSALTEFGRVPDAAVKHLIVISDGDPGPPTNATMAALKAMNVTVSTVAIGAHGGAGSTTLEQMSRMGAVGGKYYVVPANQTAKMLPRIYQREARSISRPLVFERDAGFRPHVKFPHEMIKGVGLDFPPLTGYVLTTVKDSPLVEVALVNPMPEGEKYNTLLASWTYGLGKAVAFTSDAGHRWATAWTGWENYNKLFSQIVRWSMRPGGDLGKFTLSTEVQNGKVQVVITALDKDNDFLNFLNMSARAVGPDMKPVDVKVQQVAPGRYVGQFDAPDAGSYFLLVSPGAGMSPLQSGVNVPYSAEYLDREPNEQLLKSLAAVTPRGGKPGELIQNPAGGSLPALVAQFNTFRHDLPPATSTQPIWFLLVWIAGLWFFFDVLLRRVRISFAWAPAMAVAVSNRLLRRRPAAAPSPVMARLRSRKQEITESLEHRRAAARFDSPPPPPDTPPPSTTEPLGTPPTDTPKPPIPTAQIVPEEDKDSYTSRLLKAKKKARDQQKKDTGQEPPKNE